MGLRFRGATPRKATHWRPQATQLDREGLTVGTRKRCTIGTTLTRWHTPFKPTLGGPKRRRWTRGGMTQQQAFRRAWHIVLQIGLAPHVPVEFTLGAVMLILAGVVLTLLDRIRTDLRGVRCELLRARLAARAPKIIVSKTT